ncbi:MAG: hypothetical protein PEGG_00906 [Paraeggerthella hongkongensis]|uniref:DUF975 family protein n=1 Tax=Paraeggerthella TaxID=651554 RepID=UPI001C10180E|nr:MULTISPECIES: DUF975 family protein [Paraeggerthella]MBU5404876.1 DUF975 family protein [Paraeggerthella hongkongensis]MCD2433136.1 DUF975 family protein [Paraeggerthella hominis]MDY3981372.1 DUF975 family protein [Paraeggerthella sp.]
MYARQVRAIARSALRGMWGVALVVALVAVIIGDVNAAVLPSFTVQAGDAFYTVGSSDGFSYLVHIPFAFELAFAEPFGFLGVVIGIYGVVVLIIGGAVRQGLCQFSINLIKKDAPAEFNVLFSKFSNLGKCLLLNLAMWLLIFAWSLLLIVPGIIAAYRYAMAPYIMAQNPDIGVMDAIGQSKELMRGHKGRLFWLSLTFIGWVLLSVLTFGIGFLWLNPYMEAVQAAFYLERTDQLPSTYENSSAFI